MRTFAWLSRSPYALALLAVGVWQSGACAQPGERPSLPLVAAPVVQDLAPLRVKGADDEAVGQVGAAPLEVSVSAPKVGAAIKKLRAGEMTPQQAWDSKALDVDDLIYFLEKGLDSWGGFFYEKDSELRRALVALLIKHDQKRLEHPEALSPVVRLWLSDYYESIKDARCIPLAESILNEIKQPVSGESPLVFQSVERIAWFYTNRGNYNKAAQTWLRMQSLYKDMGWSASAALQEAATQQLLSGETKKSLKTFELLIDTGDASFKTRALVAQAIIFLRDGSIKDARHYAQKAILLLDKQSDVESKKYLSQSLAVLSLCNSFDKHLVVLLPQKYASTRTGESKVSEVVAVLKVRSIKATPVISQVDNTGFKVEVGEVRKGRIDETDVFTDTQLIVTRRINQRDSSKHVVANISIPNTNQQSKLVVHIDGGVAMVEMNYTEH